MQLDHEGEMIQRRERQRTRRAPTVQERIKSWEKIDTERAIARLAPIRFKLDRSKYTARPPPYPRAGRQLQRRAAAVTDAPSILALDIATVTGICEGAGSVPRFYTMRFARMAMSTRTLSSARSAGSRSACRLTSRTGYSSRLRSTRRRSSAATTKSAARSQ